MGTLTVFTEERFLKDSKGLVYSPSGFDNAFWTRYLEVFDRLSVAARMQQVSKIPASSKALSLPEVDMLEIPYYVGAREYLHRRADIVQAIHTACLASDVSILRMPGQLSNVAHKFLARQRRCYGVELVGDPEDVFSNGGAGGLLGGFYARLFSRDTRQACRKATAVSYVTERILQSKYPVSSPAQAHSYSSIVLPKERIRDAPKCYRSNDERCRLITVGSLEQMTKGVDTVLKALPRLRNRFPGLSLSVVGEGQCRPALEELAESLHCRDIVSFLGRQPNETVFRLLDEHDVFVLATRGEGLPRVIIEAMARALPVISTRVSGNPELIPDDYLIAVDDDAELARTLDSVLSSPERLSEMSITNLRKSKRYEASIMRASRLEFYRSLLNATARPLVQPA